MLKTVLIIQGCFRCCWVVLAQSQGLFLLLTPPYRQRGWGCTVRRGHSWNSQSQLTQGILQPIWCHDQHIKEKRCCLSYQLTTGVLEPCFPGDTWAPACVWEVVNEFLIFLYLHAQLLLYLLNCLYLNPLVLSFSLFWFSPPSHGSSEQAAVWRWLRWNTQLLVQLSSNFPTLHISTYM